MAAQSTLRPLTPIQRLLTILSSVSSTKKKRSLIGGSAFSVLVVALLCEARRRRKLSRAKEQGRRRGFVRRNSGILQQDGSKIIYVPNSEKQDTEGKESFSRVIVHPTKPTTFLSHRRLFLPQPRGAAGTHYAGYHPPPVDTKPGLNLAFLHQFLALWSIMVPRIQSKETLLLSLHAFCLVSRTYLSLVVARLDGEIVRDLVAGNGRGFLLGLVKWIGVGGPAVYCNAMVPDAIALSPPLIAFCVSG